MRGRAMGRARGVGQGAVAGGGGPADGPFELNPAFWYRADNVEGADATPQTAILDQSANEHTLANNGANNATIEDAFSGTNTRRYLKAPSGNVTCEYEANGIITDGSKALTMFCVLYFGVGTTPAAGTHRHLQVANETFYIQVDQNNDDLESYADAAAGGCNINNIGANGLKVCGLRWETAAGSNNGQRLYLNSLTAGATSATSDDTALSGTSVTIYNDRGNSQVICELLVYDYALDDTQFAAVMNGLGTFYTVAIS